MKTTQSAVRIGLASVLLAALTGCTTYVVEQPQPQAYTPPPPPPAPVVVEAPPPPPPVVVQAPPPGVMVIQSDDDFYQPLSPYGQWVVVSGYGRVWRPGNVEVGWRPYANGHWELTDDGWYWESDEPWGWATYHYGRWELSPGYGWIWVPQTEWAPAWVEWRSGGGYVGWAPLPPSRVGVSVTIAPASFCFVEERHIHEPVRPTTVIVNNTTVINKTVVINKTKVVNKVVVHDGPDQAEVERVTGKKIQKVTVKDLRHKDEEVVVQKQRDVQVHKETTTHVETGIQQKPDNHQGNPLQEGLHPQRNQPAHAEPVSAPTPDTRKPVRQETAPEPVKPQPLPVAPPRDEHPDKNNRERPGEQTPKPTPIVHQPMPVEKPGHSPTANQNRDRQPTQRLNIQNPQANKQKNAPAPKKERNAKDRDANGTNSVDDGNSHRRN